MNDTSAPQPDNPNKSSLTIWLLLLSFAAPVVLAYAMYFFYDFKSFTNHGEILDPIVHIRDFRLQDENHNPVPEEELTYKWRFISFLDAQCDEACARRLHDSRQLHKALGKDQHRVIRMFVHFAPPDEALRSLIEKQHPDVVHVYGDDKIIANVIRAGDEQTRKALHQNIIYIMDPIGNVMMRFTQDQPKKDFLYDIRKLLKASQIG